MKSKKRKLSKEPLEKKSSLTGNNVYKIDLRGHGIKTVNNWDKPKSIAGFKVTKKENKRRKLRQMRFSAGTPEPTEDDMIPNKLGSALSSGRVNDDAKPSAAASGKIVGKSTKLEKNYFRLTTFPKEKDVRPLPILQKSLELIKNRYIKEEDFEWANDQLKAVRQDMTVQGIRTNFVLDVYETHARILLEHGDLNEFNQCQSMVRSLTIHGGDDVLEKEDEKVVDPWNTSNQDEEKLLKQTEEHRDEFGAYQLLYSLVQNSWFDLTTALGVAPPRSTGHVSCQHAVLVVKAVIHTDYHTFFRLYESSPHLSAYLMDFLVKRVRNEAYDRIVASYRPTMGIEYFREALKFPNLEETREFLKQSGAVFIRDRESEFWIDCKASHAKIGRKQSS
eukprot:CAMPEP_0119009662 /NCGR_PEP_ID=MMETSP1176-20130426/4517_1 /TAXON_ID=265551 /ORGANISM="Synedropsis recta cf, Strain CCMP1620" /LENGTH=390 /DNA_ID=CAMNT_0006962217 /DNA_START=126 /DNA_END=1298 /DNA_ORIENTATION=-